MSCLDTLKQRLATSLAQRSGLCEIQEQLLAIEEKLDWIIDKKLPIPPMDFEAMEQKIHELPQDNSLSVAFITDDKYFDVALLALWTLIEHQLRPYNAKLVAYKCQEKQIQRAKEIFPNLSIAKIDECNLPFRSNSHVSKACMIKLLLPEIFPNLPNLLVLDCDTLTVADLHELEGQLQDDTPLAGVRDAAVILSQYFQKQILPMTHTSDYVNAGVLYMNLEYLRRNHCISSMMELANRHTNFIYSEQDILNIMFAGKIQILPPRFNVMRKFSSDGLLPDAQLAKAFQMSLSEVQSLTPSIFHISGPNKPWNTTRAFKYPLWHEEMALFKAYTARFKAQ